LELCLREQRPPKPPVATEPGANETGMGVNEAGNVPETFGVKIDGALETEDKLSWEK